MPAPVTVEPTYQRPGIGNALIREGLSRAKELDLHQSVYEDMNRMICNPDLFLHSNGAPMLRFEVPENAFTALELGPGAPEGVSEKVK